MQFVAQGRGVSPRTYTPTPTSGTVKVMCVGDSITFGKYGDNSADPRGGYRGILYDKCRAANSRVDFVGSQTAPTGSNSGSGHEGYPGAGMANIASIIVARCGTYTPHFVCLMIGTNDQDLAADATTMAQTVVDPILTALPSSRLLVASLLPFITAGQKATYNAQLATEVDTRRKTGKYIELVDMYRLAGLTLGSVDYNEPTTNYVHPSAVGYPKVAKVWFDHLSRYL